MSAGAAVVPIGASPCDTSAGAVVDGCCDGAPEVVEDVAAGRQAARRRITQEIWRLVIWIRWRGEGRRASCGSVNLSRKRENAKGRETDAMGTHHQSRGGGFLKSHFASVS